MPQDKKKKPEEEAAGNIARSFGKITESLGAAQRALGASPETTGKRVPLAPKLRKKIRELGK